VVADDPCDCCLGLSISCVRTRNTRASWLQIYAIVVWLRVIDAFSLPGVLILFSVAGICGDAAHSSVNPEFITFAHSHLNIQILFCLNLELYLFASYNCLTQSMVRLFFCLLLRCSQRSPFGCDLSCLFNRFVPVFFLHFCCRFFQPRSRTRRRVPLSGSSSHSLQSR
jgi:hypothetical protein